MLLSASFWYHSQDERFQFRVGSLEGSDDTEGVDVFYVAFLVAILSIDRVRYIRKGKAIPEPLLEVVERRPALVLPGLTVVIIALCRDALMISWVSIALTTACWSSSVDLACSSGVSSHTEGGYRGSGWVGHFS